MRKHRFPFDHDVAAHAKSCLQRRDKRRLAKEILARGARLRLLIRVMVSGAAAAAIASAVAVSEVVAVL
jgi:hypothetical protein